MSTRCHFRGGQLKSDRHLVHQGSSRFSSLTCKSFLDAPLKWQLGDGEGGSEDYIGKVSTAKECVTRCYNKTKDGKYANGVTVDVVPIKKCYCEYGQTGKNNNSMWMNTFIRSGMP